MKSEHANFLNNDYDSDKHDYLIAGNAFVTLLRAEAFKLNFGNNDSTQQVGHKIVEHNKNVVKSILLQLTDDSIV